MRRLSHSTSSLHSSSSASIPCRRPCTRITAASSSIVFKRQSAFLSSNRSSTSPQSTSTDAKRNLSNLAGSIDIANGASWSAFPLQSTTEQVPCLTHEDFNRIFERQPSWMPSDQRPLIRPSITSGDPEGVHKYLLKESSVPQNIIDCLNVLDALVAQDNLVRAANVVASLRRQLDPSSPLSTQVYNKYLEGLVGTSIEQKAGMGRAMEWYREMETNGVKADRTTFALLSKGALSLDSMTDANRSARKIFGIWRNQGGDMGDLLCDGMFPAEEVQRSLKLTKMSLEDVSEPYRADVEARIETVKQTQPVLPEDQSTHAATVEKVRKTLTKSPALDAMRKALECLYGTTDKAEMDKVAVSLSASEEKEDFESQYGLARQRQLEEGSYATALRLWEYEMNLAIKRGQLFTRRLGVGALTWDWVQALKPVVEKHIEEIRPKDINMAGQQLNQTPEKETEPARLDHVWLTALPIDTLCALTVVEVMKVLVGEQRSIGTRAITVIDRIGRSVEMEMRARDLVKKENRGLHPRDLNIKKLLAKPKRALKYSNDFHRQILDGAKPGYTHWPYQWNPEVRMRCAAILLSSLLESAMIEMTTKDEHGEKHSQVAPAFYFTFVYLHGKRLGVVKPNKHLAERLTSAPSPNRLFYKQAPMLIPPKPWTGFDEGGYWFTREDVMRTKNSLEQRAYLKEASDRQLLGELFTGLDVLGQTCWTINRKVFDVVVKVWNSGEEVADIPAQISRLEYPPQPKMAAWDVKTRIDWMQKCKHLSRVMQRSHSMRCDLNYKLDIARAFIGERLYFPHSLDFRGRAYPVSPHFNHLGNDLCRGLLLFHEGKPLGQRGLTWLKIHLANVYGLDKLSLEEREAFVTDNIDKIFEAADNPLDGSRWWLKAEDPWQCLAICLELSAALRSEDPAAYICHLPVHQDGSCNGLQHYAALGGDMEGAKQVNLEPSDRPQDVYTGVAKLVIADVEQQAKEGNEIAKYLRGKISRKIVKQTVMTSVYGVTYIGAKGQIKRALKAKGEVDVNQIEPSADLIARATFRALENMFKGAHEIQAWLKECTKRICRSVAPEHFKGMKQVPENDTFVTGVVWTSPLGLPIVQPYRKDQLKSVETMISSIQISHPSTIGPVDPRKQQGAVAPNYIHSLDASHMLKTAIACKNAGLSFASVHDSFWTHACDVDIMNSILREAFVRMHGDNLIGKLKSEFEERYKGYMMYNRYPGQTGPAWVPLEFPPLPKKGDFDVSRLKGSTYFFS